MSIARHIGIALTVGTLLAATAALAAENPHWNKSTCASCHVSAAPARGNNALRHATAQEGCDECHSSRGDALACRHRSDLPVGDMAVPDYYRAALDDGRITCTTCHDLTFQCNNPRQAYRFQNPGFLRDRVSRSSGEQCFECHDQQGYKSLAPHDGTADGPPLPTCALCHERQPQTMPTGEIDLAFNMQKDLNDLCRGCHVTSPHPRGMGFGKQTEGWVHLVKPSVQVVMKMEKSFAATGVTLPLNPGNGEIYCATCHNPHGSRATVSSGKTAKLPEHRLRLDKICQACHDK